MDGMASKRELTLSIDIDGERSSQDDKDTLDVTGIHDEAYYPIRGL
jgi:hypothetical protein